MVALKRRHLGVLLATFALVLSFFGLAQFVGAQAPAHAAPLSCPAPTTNVSNKVTLDWDNAQLVDHAGRETKAVGDWWDLGIKLPWKTDGRVEGRRLLHLRRVDRQRCDGGERSAPERCP